MNRVDTVLFNLCVGNAGGKGHQAAAVVGSAAESPGSAFPDLSLVSCFPVGHRSRGGPSLRRAEPEGQKAGPDPRVQTQIIPRDRRHQAEQGGLGGPHKRGGTGSSETPHPGEWVALAGVAAQEFQRPGGQGDLQESSFGGVSQAAARGTPTRLRRVWGWDKSWPPDRPCPTTAWRHPERPGPRGHRVLPAPGMREALTMPLMMGDPGSDITASPEPHVQDNYSAGDGGPGSRVRDTRANGSLPQLLDLASQAGSGAHGDPGPRSALATWLGPGASPRTHQPRRGGRQLGVHPSTCPHGGAASTSARAQPTPAWCRLVQDVNPSRGAAAAQPAHRHAHGHAGHGGKEPRCPVGAAQGVLVFTHWHAGHAVHVNPARVSSWRSTPYPSSRSWLRVTPGDPGGRAPAERLPPPPHYLRQTPRWS